MIQNRSFLYFSVFLSGMTTLAVEFTASRMLQTVFGTSNIVWANVIGLVLLFLTLGYFIGGRLADAHPRPVLFYMVMTAAGFTSIFFLLMTSVVLRSTVVGLSGMKLGAVAGSFVGVLMAIAIPITLLGCISPFAIRLGVQHVEEAGRISGRIYAISTWGSLLGTYLPVLYVIPTAGSRMTAIIFGAILMLTGLAGVFKEAKHVRQKVAPTLCCLLVVPFAVSWSQGKIKDTAGQVFETESPYNYVEVRKRNDCYSLFLNEGAAVHSVYCEDRPIPRRNSVYSAMTIAPLLSSPETLQSHPAKRMAIVGLGAGTLVKLYNLAYGTMEVDGIEIDPEIVSVARTYFDMNDPGLTVHVGDGRYELNRLEGNYDVIALDAYRPPYIPWHLTTREFFGEIKSKLNENGKVVINTFRPLADRRLVNAITSSLSGLFSSIYTIDTGSYNTAIIASVSPTFINNIQSNMENREFGERDVLRIAFDIMKKGLKPTEPSDIVFNDEVAPVEPMIDSMLFHSLLSNKTI